MKVWIIGNPEAVLGFALVGVHGTSAQKPEEIHRALDDALDNAEIGLVLITDDCANLVNERMKQLARRVDTPIVLEIPSPSGVNPDRKTLKQVVEQAIGIQR